MVFPLGHRLRVTTALLLCTASFSIAAGVAHAEAAADTPSAATPAADDDAQSDGEVLVTARRVKERLQDVPLSISAFGGDDLARNNHIRLEDINQLSPNTNISIGNGHQASFTIRGLGANPANDGLEGSAGVFLDGVYLGRPGMAAVNLIDIEQIEVLRGPQGTLFGKNTTAGAINITTALPSFTPGMRVELTGGNYTYVQAQGTVTGPISDTIAARLTGYRTVRDGTVDNIYTGRRTNDQQRWGVRGQLLFKPSEDFSVRLIGEYALEQQSTGAVLVFDSYGQNPPALRAKLAATNAIIAVDPDGLSTAINGADETGTRSSSVSGEINWKLDDFTLTSITGYRHWVYSSLSDSDGTSADVIDGGYDLTSNQFTQELRLALPRMGRVDAIVGLYYFNQKIRTDSKAVYGADAAAWLSGIPNALLPTYAAVSPAIAGLLAYNNSRWDTWATPHADSYAAFGQATWHVTPAWNVTGGVRVTHEKKTETVWRPNPTGKYSGLPIAALAAIAAAPIGTSTTDTSPSFLLSTDYHVMPGLMAYGLVSRGQKAGGINSTLPVAGLGPESLVVKPEVATNFEMGLKADLLDHRVKLNLSIFRTDVRDYQATYVSLINGTSTQTLTNVGKVRTQGAEGELTIVPVRGLSLRGFVGYTDATYRSYPDAPCPIETTGRPSCDLTGRPVAGAPKWTAGANGSFEQPIGRSMAAYTTAEYSYRSSYYGALDDSRYSVAGDYGIVNIRVGLRSTDDHWDISAWVRNLANGRYRTGYLNYAALIPGMYAPGFVDPRTYGLTLRSRF